VSEQLKEKLLKDLKETGFPLEMEISKHLQTENWSVTNGSYYIDKDENKGREIDIIARVHRSAEVYKELSLEVVFSLIMEIKKSEQHPWVFFTSPINGPVENLIPKKYQFSGFSTEPHRINRVLRKNTIKIKERVGRSFYQGFTKNGGRDDIYKALSGVTKATQHFIDTSTAKGDTSGDRLLHSFEPVIVIQGKLFEAFLQRGELILEESNYIQTFFNYLSPNYSTNSRNIIHVITKEYLHEFITEHKESLNSFFEDLRENDIY
jgi:hypothetical protein